MENRLEIVSRADAKAQGLKWYFTGVPCKHGHIAERQVVNGRCRECGKAGSIANNAKHRDEVNRVLREKYADDPLKYKERVRSYRKNNVALCKAKREEFDEVNPGWRKRVHKEWVKNNPSKMRMYDQNRRARKVAGGGTISHDIVDKLMTLQQGKCPCCGKSLDAGFHVDHIMPLALGGSNTDDNIQLLTPACNREKNAKHPIDFMQSRGFLL